MEEDIGVADIHRIDECRLLVQDEISIVSYSRRDAPHILEALLHAVIDAYVVDRVRDLWYLVHSLCSDIAKHYLLMLAGSASCIISYLIEKAVDDDKLGRSAKLRRG